MHIVNLVYIAWFNFLVKYRRTVMGPVWLLFGPSVFILILGNLFSQVGGMSNDVFIPHLCVGLITWTLIQGFVVNSTNVFQRSKSYILQAGVKTKQIIVMDMLSTIILFAHQLVIVLFVLIYYKSDVGVHSLYSLVGIAFIIINGYSLSIIIGAAGARYRDINEMVQAIMRIAFLATPIVWMVGDGMRGGALSHYMSFNPLYHFLEIVRQPLLGGDIAMNSWLVVILITTLGLLIQNMVYKKYHSSIPLWL